jgi:hypothetical protein
LQVKWSSLESPAPAGTSGTAEEAGNVIKIDGFLKSQALGPGQDLVCLVMFSQSAPYEN